jgi:hypothetical protein
VEFYSKNKFEKSVHFVGFVIRIYHDARTSEYQNTSVAPCQFSFVSLFIYELRQYVVLTLVASLNQIKSRKFAFQTEEGIQIIASAEIYRMPSNMQYTLCSLRRIRRPYSCCDQIPWFCTKHSHKFKRFFVVFYVKH